MPTKSAVYRMMIVYVLKLVKVTGDLVCTHQTYLSLDNKKFCKNVRFLKHQQRQCCESTDRL